MLNIQVNPRTGEASIAGGAPARTSSLLKSLPGQAPQPTWELRTEEQPYAFLPLGETPARNRWGQAVDLIELSEGSQPVGRSMYINDNPSVGANPDRNKQHGFFFTADNCIGCHACEAACSEKNDNPPHLAFRSVGYVEGGSWPDYKRMNISMACNHCDDPVCLKGCPTRAYTKHSEYGAVLQDPETCFGCGYCTWVCPYNAPQLDPVKGQVSKCNMCVDRLEVGLKPACVAACVGNALDFGVIDTVPAGREQARIEIPGFPSPEITHPNIRFQQIRQLPDEMTRTDSMPVKYQRDGEGRFRPAIDRKHGQARQWSLASLSSRENPLVLFTLGAQAAIGAFALAFVASRLGVPGLGAFAASAAYPLLLLATLALVAFGLFMSTMHLGKPKRFYRGFNNLRHSPVSREGLGIALFMAFGGLHLASSLPAQPWLRHAIGLADGSAWVGAAATLAGASGTLALVAGAAGLYYMTRCYRIKARPFWDHWQVGSAFFGNALSLGSVLAGALALPTLLSLGLDARPALAAAAAVLALGVALEAVGLRAHARDLGSAGHEGAASHHVQTTRFGHTYALRNALLVAALAGAVALASWAATAATAEAAALGALAFGGLGAMALAAALIGRALFYVLVIPTTMPGAFFWKNKGFEDHARATGLARMPQVGVAPLRH